MRTPLQARARRRSKQGPGRAGWPCTKGLFGRCVWRRGAEYREETNCRVYVRVDGDVNQGIGGRNGEWFRKHLKGKYDSADGQDGGL